MPRKKSHTAVKKNEAATDNQPVPTMAVLQVDDSLRLPV
jgi:hypothetical protein